MKTKHIINVQERWVDELEVNRLTLHVHIPRFKPGCLTVQVALDWRPEHQPKDDAAILARAGSVLTKSWNLLRKADGAEGTLPLLGFLDTRDTLTYANTPDDHDEVSLVSLIGSGEARMLCVPTDLPETVLIEEEKVARVRINQRVHVLQSVMIDGAGAEEQVSCIVRILRSPSKSLEEAAPSALKSATEMVACAIEIFGREKDRSR